MFFIFGISNGDKKLDFVQTLVCSRCGQFGRLEVYMTYMYFSLFFIPVFRWGTRYYAQSSCCQSVYEIEKELGHRIQKGEAVVFNENDLKSVSNTHYQENCRSCSKCGYPASKEFDYCPKCGSKL